MFELTFQICIVKKSSKISLVLVLPKCAPWLSLRDRKYQNIVCDRLQENAFSKIKVPSQSHRTIRLKNEKCFPNE